MDAPASLTYIGTSVDNSDTATHTYPDHAIGAAASDREVIIAVNYDDNATNSLSSATIGGETATIHVDTGTTSGIPPGVAIISALVDTGTTGTIVLNFTAAIRHSAVNVYRAVDLTSRTPHATDSATVNGGASASLSVNVPANGILLAGAVIKANKTATWTGATKNAETGWTEEGTESAASESGLDVETGRAVDAGWSANGDNAAAAATWQ